MKFEIREVAFIRVRRAWSGKIKSFFSQTISVGG